MTKKLVSGNYTLNFMDGGIEAKKDSKLLYLNKRPMFVTVKTVSTVNKLYDNTYS